LAVSGDVCFAPDATIKADVLQVRLVPLADKLKSAGESAKLLQSRERNSQKQTTSMEHIERRLHLGL
jgi:hypothetical protein